MDLERALETQRARLLQLLAGWVVMLGFLSAGPLALPLPRWVRAFFATLVTRAEFAAQSLVQVSACLQITGGAVDPVRGQRPAPTSEATSDVPSTQALFQRIEALRLLLETLPRHTRRLLRVQKSVGVAFDYSVPLRVLVSQDHGAKAGANWVAPRVERPPDKAQTDFDGLVRTPPALQAGGAGVFGKRFVLPVQS